MTEDRLPYQEVIKLFDTIVEDSRKTVKEFDPSTNTDPVYIEFIDNLKLALAHFDRANEKAER